MTGDKLNDIIEHLELDVEDVSAVLDAGLFELRGWQMLGSTGIASSPYQTAVLEALEQVSKSLGGSAAGEFGKRFSMWRRIIGVGYAVYCVLKMHHEGMFVELAEDYGTDMKWPPR